MHYGKVWALVDLQQRERRARRLELGLAGHRPEIAPRESGLSRAEIPGKPNEVARASEAREPLRKRDGGRLVRQIDRLGRLVLRSPPDGHCQATAFVMLRDALTGKKHVTLVPSPSAESRVTRPPCSSTNARTIDSPKPGPRWRVPPVWLSKRSNTRSNASGAMPRPRSDTLNTTSSSRRIAAKVTVWPSSEKPIALESRLNSTWRTRRPSARSRPR